MAALISLSLSLPACQEAMELYTEQVQLQEKSKPLPKQESKAYTKIKVCSHL